MAEIPRFQAQIQSLQVPSMKNYQEQQNASITQSLAQFGSELMTGVINAKKQKDSKYNELLQEEKTLSGRDDTVKKNNENTIKESFNTSFYNDALTAFETIAKDNEGNPAEIEAQSTAYIDGLVSDFPEEQQKKVREGLDYLKNAYANQSLENYNARQINGAKQDVINNMFNAKDIAVSSVQQGAPEEIQMVSSMNYVQNVHKAKEAGEITPEEEVKLLEAFGQDIIINHLGDILNDKNISVEEQLKWVRRFSDGKTGDVFIDSVMSPSERINAVNMAMNNISQLRAFEQKMSNERDELQQEAWKNNYVQAVKNAYNTRDFYQLQKIQNSLVDSAETPEQINLATNLINKMDLPSNQLAKVELDRQMRNGLLTQDVVDGALNAGVISANDYAKYSEQLNEPLARNKGTDIIQVAMQQARKSYGYTPFGSNNGYETFMANLEAKLSDKLMTGTELNKAVTESFAETDKLYPKSAQGTVQKIEEFNQKNGVSVDKITEEINNAAPVIAERIAGKATKVTADIMAKAQHQALMQRAEQWMIENNKKPEDINVFVQEYKDITGGQ